MSAAEEEVELLPKKSVPFYHTINGKCHCEAGKGKCHRRGGQNSLVSFVRFVPRMIIMRLYLQKGENVNQERA